MDQSRAAHGVQAKEFIVQQPIVGEIKGLGSLFLPLKAPAVFLKSDFVCFVFKRNQS